MAQIVTYVREGDEEELLQQWMKAMRQPSPEFCAVVGCANRDVVAARVQLENRARWYVLPLCHHHVHSRRELIIADDAPLVPYLPTNKSQRVG